MAIEAGYVVGAAAGTGKSRVVPGRRGEPALVGDRIAVRRQRLRDPRFLVGVGISSRIVLAPRRSALLRIPGIDALVVPGVLARCLAVIEGNGVIVLVAVAADAVDVQLG